MPIVEMGGKLLSQSGGGERFFCRGMKRIKEKQYAILSLLRERGCYHEVFYQKCVSATLLNEGAKKFVLSNRKYFDIATVFLYLAYSSSG